MSRYDDAICGEVETFVTLMMRRITKKNALGGAWCKFVWDGSGHIEITAAVESAKMIIFGG